MKRYYIKPTVNEVVLCTSTVIATSSVDTEIGNTPSAPDANGQRESWGDLWGNR